MEYKQTEIGFKHNENEAVIYSSQGFNSGCAAGIKRTKHCAIYNENYTNLNSTSYGIRRFSAAFTRALQ